MIFIVCFVASLSLENLLMLRGMVKIYPLHETVSSKDGQLPEPRTQGRREQSYLKS